jgi:hypothetical protein
MATYNKPMRAIRTGDLVYGVGGVLIKVGTKRYEYPTGHIEWEGTNLYSNSPATLKFLPDHEMQLETHFE